MPPPPPLPDDADARAELASCVLNSSWAGTLAGVALAVPVCVRRGGYGWLLVLGSAGTAVDMAVGLARCREAGAAAAAATDAARRKGGR